MISKQKKNPEVVPRSKPKSEEEAKTFKNEEKNIKATYKILKIIGTGTFGVVYEAKINETNEKVAIKKVFQDKKYKNRELEIIKELNHFNVINLLDSFFTQGEKKDEVYLNLVMEFMPETLSKLIKTCNKARTPFPPLLIKLFSYQMLKSIGYLHGVGVCHRDLKPQNVLVDSGNGKLKICDFGSAKKLVKGEPNISYICSRYYRAPELIFGSTDYSSAIDTWSVGCIIAEMYKTEPLFPGESAVDQLVEIIKILGTPTPDQVRQMNPNHHNEFKFPSLKPQHLSKVFKKEIDPLAVDLLNSIFIYSPKERISPVKALAHPFFDELRKSGVKIGEKNLPEDLFEFGEIELMGELEMKKFLVPEWYLENKEQLNK